MGHVASDDEGQVVSWGAVMDRAQRIDRVRLARAVKLQVRDREALVARRRQPAHLESVLAARIVERLLVRGHADRHEHDPVEPELHVRLLRADKMPEMRRVEGPAEDADPRHAARGDAAR